MSPSEPRSKPSAARIITGVVLFPPVGFYLLWRRELSSRVGRVLALLATLLYSLPYAALCLWIAMQVTGLELEWRGGFPPVLTFEKSKPDYDAVEAHRSTQSANVPSEPTDSRATSNYWTGFRGPNRDGHYTEMPIRTDWPAEGLPLLWRQPVGGGYASFAIAEGRAYTIEQRRDQEVVTAYDLESGLELWAHFYHARFDESMGGEGPRSTPTYDDGSVYALGATGEFHCLDAATGAVLWQKNILLENGAPNLYWAQSASPLIVGGLLILAPGGPNDRSVVAYDKRTGERRWGTRTEPAAYSSPMLADLAGRSQLIVAVQDSVLGLDPTTGNELWSFPWTIRQNNRNIAQPVVTSTNRLFLSAGYGTGCVLVELETGTAGVAAREVWRNRNLKNKFSSSVLWQGHLYGLDESILACLNAETGERRWKDGRYGYGQLLLASGHLIVLTGEGELVLVKATAESHQEMARFTAIPGKTWNHPALGGGRLVVRNASQMACYDVSP
jgi:outer membrane protein assembly factor BamB